MGPRRLNALQPLLAVLILMSGACGLRETTHNVEGDGARTLAGTDANDKETEIGAAEQERSPKVSEFILGAGDRLEIMVYRKDDLRRTVQIDPSGKIMYPFAGDIEAAGLSIFQLRDRIRDGLSRYVIDPQVTVSIESIQSQKIIVLGEVRIPGFFPADTSVTAIEAISRAGGFTLDGKRKTVLLINGGMDNPELKVLDLEKALTKGDLTDNVVLEAGDIVYVPRTFIADVDRFFAHLSTMISPIVGIESAWLLGQEISEGGRTRTTIPIR